MATKEETPFEKGIKERLGNLITFWYPTAPKVNGLCIIRDTLENFAAWNRFITNYHKIGKRQGYIQVYEYIMRTNDYRSLVEWGFNWEETPEGHAYWKDLNERVKKALDEEENKGINLKELCKIQETSKKNFPITARPHVSQARKSEFNNSLMNPIYALLSGATSVCEFAEMLHELAPRSEEELVKVNMPLTSTTIMSIAEVN